MKKIYILTAVFALLTLSLNAQVDTKAKPVSKTKLASYNFNEVLRGIKGMESILSVSGSANGQYRAPLRYDAERFNTLGPFTGDNFDYGIGFPEAYPVDPQDILVTTVLNRSEFQSHIGEKIVGFRFALWGDASKTVKVSDFITYPLNSNSGFDQNHLYEWKLTDLEGNEPPSGDDPTETTKYVKVTSSSDLTSGEYLIVCEAQNVIFDGSVTTLNGANNAAAPTISNGAIEYTADLDGKDFTIDMTNGTVKSASGYYIGCESSNNTITSSQTTQYNNTITVNSGTASITYNYNNANRPLKCNTQNNVFRYYKTTSSGVADIQLYKKVTTSSKTPRRANRATLEKTICDGTNTNGYLPVYGLYVDNNYQVNQVIYPASELTDLVGQTITSMTFYTNANIGENLGGSTWTVKLGTTTQSTFASSLSSITRVVPSDVVTVASGIHLPTGSNTMTITFSTPFTYTGNNLLVDFQETAYTSNYASTSFYGVNQPTGTYTGFNSYGTSLSNGHYGTGGGRAFLPKVTFTYEGDSNDGYAILEPGQWHEFYLDQPVEFQVENDDDQIFMGYWYKQYPLSSQNDEVINPAAVNSQSTGHSHYVNMVAGSAGAGDLVVHLPYSMNIRSIAVYDTNGNSLTSWNATTAYNNSDYTSVSLDGSTYAAYNLPTGWSISDGNYLLSWNNSSIGRLGYLMGDDDLTIASSALNGNTTVNVVLNVYDDNGNGTISVNGESKTISGSSLTDYSWNNVNLTATVYERSWFNPDFSEVGDLAVQLIFETTEPELIAPEDGSDVYVGTHEGAGVSTTIPVSGHNLTGDLTVSVTGDGFSVSPTTISAADANAGTSVTVTYNGTDENATGTLTITSSNGEVETVNVNLTANYVAPVPELLAPTDGATVNVGTNPGAGVSTTITVNGYYLTGDLTISVEGTGFSVEPTTISAADANAGTTITVTYNGYSSAGTGTLTITSSNGEVEPVTVNLTGNFVPQPIEPVTGLLRLHLLLVDQLKANIPDDNSHADSYRYVLKYEPTGGETKESSPVKVDIHKTECEVKGYYTKAEIDGDTDGALTMDVLTADVEFNLTDDDNTIDFYNLQGKPNEYPALGKDYLTKLQQTTGFVYYEMLEESPNKGDDYPAGLHHYYDDSTPILTGTYTNGFMSYAPSLSTWGVARRYFEDDGLDNTYGAPIWRTRVGKVEVQTPEIQKQVINAGTPQEANNPHTTWTVGNKTYCLYFLGVNAQGTLPRPYTTDYPQGTNIKYEPYMFRVFVSSQSGKLRKFDRVLNPNGGGYEAVDAGPIGANEKYCVGSFYKNEGWTPEEMFFHKPISAQNTTNGFADDGGNDFDPYAWDGIMKFGAEDGIMPSDVKVYVRFYYMVEGWDATRDGEARPGNGSEGSGDPGAIGTYIFEYQANAEVVGVTYVNAQGMTSDKPFDGMNIVVTKFSDGTTTTTKVMR